jgi:hypothetical protein
MQSEGESLESYKYIVNTKALESLLHKFSLKVDALARSSRWGELELPESSFTQLHRFIERPFLSSHCLISGIDSHRMPRGTEQQRQKAVEDMCKVVIGDGVVQMSSEDASMLSRGIANPIRMRNLGWEKLKNDRPSYLVALESNAHVWDYMTAGPKVYDRVLMGPSVIPTSKRGDYAIRQFLRPKEAEHLAKIRGEVKDVGLVLIRGLTKIVEIDEAILRRTREHYREHWGMEVCVIMTTLQHDNPKAYLDLLADEPIMAVISCGLMTGGSALRKGIELSREGTGTLRIGSVTLQTFVDPSVVQGRGGPTTGRIWEIDSSNMDGEEDVCDLIIELGDRINSVEILVKARRAKLWYA